jgi:hypothetical protein
VPCAVKPLAIYLAGAMLLLSAEAAAQRPDSKDQDRLASECDRFAGAAREHCLLQERGRVERPPHPGRDLAGSCDALIGPEKELCLSKGGTVEAGMPSGSGASRPPPANRRGQ